MPVAGGPFIQKTGILLEVDSADKTSYSGTGTTWINQIRPGTNNGTLNNISFDSTDAKGALVFTGSNTFVDFGNLGPSLTSSFSFQVAFEPAATASGQPYTILSYASASSTSSITFKLDYTSSNQTVVLTTFAGTGSQNIVYVMSASVASGSWNIVHGTFGSKEVTLYVNGLSRVYTPTTGSVVGYNTSNRLYAGLNFGSTSGYYSGSIANIIVNNADLNIVAVTKNYNALASRFGLPVRNAPSVDADANSFFNRIAAAGGISTEVEQLAVNQLVLDLKSYGIWTSMKAIYPMIGASAAACAQNLKSSNFTGTFYGGWVFTSTGAKPNGTNGYMRTNCFANEFTLDSQHLSNYSRQLTNTGNTELGFASSDAGKTNYVMFQHSTSGIYAAIQSSDALMDSINDPGYGLIISNRRDGTNIQRYYRNIKTEQTSISGGLGTLEIYMSLFNGLGLYSVCEIAFGSLGNGLTDTQASNLYTAVQAFQTSLGRQV
jgi:hypothetical protein